MDTKTVGIEAIRVSGKILMENFGKIKKINLKQKNDQVTNVDIEAENAIKAIVRKNFPTHTIVAEESEIEKNLSEYTWYIDPISSTMNYIHGQPHFATVISLQRNTDFIFSAVLDPYFNELFYAEKGKGAFLNTTRITASSITHLSDALISIVLNFRKEGEVGKGLEAFQQIITKAAGIRRIGSLALELCYIAAGRIDGQVYTNTDIFSLPAGKLIVEEAGGNVTDFQGNRWTISSLNTVASNAYIHNELLSHIR